MSESFLLIRHPELASLERIELCELPTPVKRLARMEKVTGLSSLWIKRDDLSSPTYGGNKPRKLEFVLGEAKKKRKRRIVTVGPIGSHHVLAAAIFGKQCGFRVTALLFKRPVTDRVLLNLKAAWAAGADLHYTQHPAQTPAMGLHRFIEGYLRDDRKLPYFLQPGGSSSLGSIGYVNAAFELAAQIAAGELPEPEAIFLPLGSGGTYSGLLLGCRLAGLNVKVYGVRVTDRLVVNQPLVLQQMIFTLDNLRALAPDLPKSAPGLKDIRILHNWYGPGYGRPTPASEAAARLMLDREGLELDDAYTAKTFAALLDFVRTRGLQSRPILYWHTLNGAPIDDLAALCSDWRELPRDFHPLFKKSKGG